MTKILKINPENPEMDKIREAARIIRSGGIVVFPTETVYGIGTNALNEKAVRKLFEIKNRPLTQPLGIFIENPKKIKRFVKKVPKEAKKLIPKFWPGPLTLIFKKTKRIPDIVTAKRDTIGIRIPNHKVAIKLLKESKVPMVQSSANKSGRKPPKTAREAFRQLKNINLILDGGRTKIGIPSTIIDVTKKEPIIIRKGALAVKKLTQVHPRSIHLPLQLLG